MFQQPCFLRFVVVYIFPISMSEITVDNSKWKIL